VDGSQAQAPAAPKPKLRRTHPRWAKPIGTAFLWLAFVPFMKLKGKKWARYVSRGLTRMFAQGFAGYAPQASDVIVCSYFKSGTNWTLQIAVQIAHRGRARYEHIHDLVPWPEIPARSRYAVAATDDTARRESPTGLRVIKTHLPFGPVPYTPAARYICVVRDPKDVFVSSYHFLRANVGPQLMPSLEAWLDAYLSPDTAIGSWAEHLASYWQARDRPNVLFLTYEQMRESLPQTVDAIAQFLGVSLTEAERTAVIEQATFAHMKSIGHKFDSPGAPWAPAAGAMIRRGAHGGSDELLSAEQRRRIDDYWRAELERLHCDFPYDAAFTPANRRPA
jgi:amine sulfotransferase